jgi:hypothetical protein
VNESHFIFTFCTELTITFVLLFNAFTSQGRYGRRVGERCSAAQSKEAGREREHDLFRHEGFEREHAGLHHARVCFLSLSGVWRDILSTSSHPPPPLSLPPLCPPQAVLKPPSKKDAPVNVVRCALTRCSKTKQLKIVLQNIPNSHFLITHLMTQFQVNRIVFVLFCHVLFLLLHFSTVQLSFRNFCTSLCTKEWATTCRGMNSSSFSSLQCSL